MKKSFRLAVLVIVPLLVLAAAPATRKTETVGGVRVVHNEKGGLGGKALKISLELVRKIGDIDTEDENVAFNYPADVAVDKDGNIYVLDSANARIQKSGPDGVLLGELPLSHFVDVISISGDSLFLIDRERGGTVYQYRIIEK